MENLQSREVGRNVENGSAHPCYRLARVLQHLSERHASQPSCSRIAIFPNVIELVILVEVCEMHRIELGM